MIIGYLTTKDINTKIVSVVTNTTVSLSTLLPAAQDVPMATVTSEASFLQNSRSASSHDRFAIFSTAGPTSLSLAFRVFLPTYGWYV